MKNLKKDLENVGFKANPKHIYWTKGFGIVFHTLRKFTVMFPAGSVEIIFDDYELTMSNGICYTLKVYGDGVEMLLHLEMVM